MILLLPNEITDSIISNLKLNNFLLLRQTHKLFDNILHFYTLEPFFKSLHITELLLKSHFTKALFYKYVENITYDSVPNFHIKFISIDSKESHPQNTIKLLQILMKYVKEQKKSQMRMLITSRMVKFIKQISEHRKCQKGNECKKCKKTFRVFFNFIKYPNEFLWEEYDFDFFELYHKINIFVKTNENYNSKEVLKRLINDLNI